MTQVISHSLHLTTLSESKQSSIQQYTASTTLRALKFNYVIYFGTLSKAV